MNFAQLMMMHSQMPQKAQTTVNHKSSIPFNLNDGESFELILNELWDKGLTFDKLVEKIVKQLSVDLSYAENIKKIIESFIDLEDLVEGKEIIEQSQLKSLAEQLVGYLTEMGEEITVEEILTTLKDYLNVEEDFQGDQLPLTWQNVINITTAEGDHVHYAEQLTDEQLTKIAHIIRQFSAYIGKEVNEGNIQSFEKIAPEVIKLLNNWQAIFNQTNLSTNDIKQLLPDDDLSELWKNLVERFNKRTNVAKTAHYNGDAKVRSIDVANWLKHLLKESDFFVKQHALTTSTPKSRLSNPAHPTIHISPIEQYIIYAQQTKGEPIEQQVLNQFRHIVDTRNFFPYQTNINQLSITLKPDHLGDIIVRMTEINGEMTVKLLVSSQATKRLLEANIHQLKHMFSPHQVVIEENEEMIEDLTPKDQLQDETNEESFKDSEDEHEQEQTSDPFTDEFQRILNEIV